MGVKTGQTKVIGKATTVVPITEKGSLRLTCTVVASSNTEKAYATIEFISFRPVEIHNATVNFPIIPQLDALDDSLETKTRQLLERTIQIIEEYFNNPDEWKIKVLDILEVIADDEQFLEFLSHYGQISDMLLVVRRALDFISGEELIRHLRTLPDYYELEM